MPGKFENGEFEAEQSETGQSEAGQSEMGQPAHTQSLDDRVFDLLVDGELDSARQQELLSHLDTTPDGWRRCALAFLEAQAWRSDLRSTIDAPISPRSPGAGRAAVRKSWATRAGRWSLLALGLCLAFGAGWLTRPGTSSRRDSDLDAPSAALANGETASDETTKKTPLEPDDEGPQRPGSMRMAGILTLQVDDHGQVRQVRVPILDASGIDVQSLLEQAPATRTPAIEALERRGNKVETHRQLLTVDLKDGRKLILPVDQVDVRFANRVYQ